MLKNHCMGGFCERKDNKKLSITIIAFLTIVLLLSEPSHALSNSIVYPTNPNFQTGIVKIVQTTNTSSFITTSATMSYVIAYGATMLTPSLNATLGVMSCYFPMDSLNFGWDVKIFTLNETGMIV
jgi:hypothetical protein